MKLKTIDFKFLEYLAFWQERLTGTRLAELLGVERTHAHRAVLSPYMRMHGSELANKDRVWSVRDPSLTPPRYGPASVEDLFRFLDGLEFLRDLPGETLGVPLEDVTIDLPVEQNLNAFRTLYAAAAQRRAVRIHYRSRKREADYLFSPHAVVRTAARPHFRGFMRGFDGRDGFFTDLVPARVIRAEMAGPEDYVGPEGDLAWETRIKVRLRLSEAIPDDMRETMMREYAPLDGFSDGVLTITGVRACLATYLCRHLRYRVFDVVPIEVWIPEEEYAFGAGLAVEPAPCEKKIKLNFSH
jgi:hypothetical protein